MIAKKYDGIYIESECARKLENIAATFNIQPQRFISFFFESLFKKMEIFNLVTGIKNADDSQPVPRDITGEMNNGKETREGNGTCR